MATHRDEGAVRYARASIAFMCQCEKSRASRLHLPAAEFLYRPPAARGRCGMSHSRGDPRSAFGGASAPEVSIRILWPSGHTDGANSGAPDTDDVCDGASGSPASCPSSSPVAKELLDTLTERVSELEARRRRDAREIELLRAEVDSKTAEIAAKEADIKFKDTELAQAEQVAHSRGLLVESLLAELEETKASLEYAQLETLMLSNGLDFVKAAQVCACAHILCPDPAGRALRVCGGCRLRARVTRARALPLTSTRMCVCRNASKHRVQHPAPGLAALHTRQVSSPSPRTSLLRLPMRRLR